jgi:hypothetical protein
VFGQQAQAQQAAPVVTAHRDIAQVEAIEDRLAEPVDVGLVGVGEPVGGLVGFAEADQVGGDTAMSGRDQRRDDVAVEVTPGWLTVQQQHSLAGCLGWTRLLVDVVHP